MSKDYRHGPKHHVPKVPKGKRQEQTDSREAKLPTERHIKDAISRAVRCRNTELFDDYDERDW